MFVNGHQSKKHPLLLSTKVAAPTLSPSPDTDVDEADMEEEDDEVVEEEEEEEEEEGEDEVDEEEDEAEEEDNVEAMAVRDPEEYEYPIDSGTYQTSDYLDSFYSEKSPKPTTSAPLMKADSGERPKYLWFILSVFVKNVLGCSDCLVAVVNIAGLVVRCSVTRGGLCFCPADMAIFIHTCM